jgi:hypothetical protein
MTPKLTSEMRTALAERNGQPIEVEDEETNRVYLLFESQLANLLLDQRMMQEFLLWRLLRKSDENREELDRWIIKQLEEAEEEVAAGLVTPWDVNDFRKKLQARIGQASSR